LSQDRALASYFERVASLASPKAASNWVMGEALGRMNARGWSLAQWQAQVSATSLGELVKHVEDKTLTGPLAEQARDVVAEEGVDAPTVLARPEYQVRGGADELLPLVQAVIQEHPGPVSQYKGGKSQTMGFLVGQVMKKSGGQAVPQVVKELLEKELA